MKNIILALIITMFTYATAEAQRSRSYILAIGSNYSGEALNVFDLRDKKGTEGSFYWNEEWVDGSIKLVNGKTITDMPLKYDILSNTLEIKIRRDIKVLPGELIEEFVLISMTDVEEEIFHRFIRLDLFFDKDVIDRTFFELLQEGKEVSLLRKTNIDVLQPNYVAILDAGTTKAKIIKKEKLMLFDGVRLTPLPKSKKRALKTLDKYKEGASAHYQELIKQKKGKRNRVNDLIQIIEFVNA